MKTLLTELRHYETLEFSYSLTYTKSILNKDSISNEIITIANSKIDPNFLTEGEKFTLYSFVFKDDKIFLLNKSVFNNYYSKLFSNPDMKTFKSFISDIENNKALKINDYSVRFFIFQKDSKKEYKTFNKLYQIILDKHNEIKNRYDEKYFSNFFNTAGTFFLDSYSFFASKFLTIIGIIILYSLYYHKNELTLLGIPSELISDMEILSILKLYASVFIPIFTIAVVFIVIVMYLESIYTIKSFLYKSFKVMTSIVSYLFIGSLIVHFNFFTINKETIKIDDFFLNQYFSESFYPRFAIFENNETKLIIGEKKKDLYYYDVKTIIQDSSLVCESLEKKNFERAIITMLKSSKYVGTKNILTIKKPSKYKILNAQDSFNRLHELYCSK